jgi:hypothetical protein
MDPPKTALARHLQPLVGPFYTKELAHRECPHCRYLLPFNIERVPSINIVVVGDNSSGKSSYIAALMRQLVEGQWMTREQYTNVSCLTHEVERAYYRFYEYDLLKGENEPAPAGYPAFTTTPVIYELSLSSSPRRPLQKFNILLYDVPGRNHLSAEQREWYSRCLLHASAMIFLIAPENLPAIASSLPSSSRLPRQLESSELLHSTLQLLEQQRHFIERGGRSSHFPLAVTLSKSDLLRFVHSFNVDFFVSRDCAYDNETSLGDIEAIDREVRELLAVSGNRSLISITQEVPLVKFFAVSALGHSVNSQEKFPNAEPCRCLDPVLWIFHELGIMAY